MKQVAKIFVCLVATMAMASSLRKDTAITKVVKLLQNMAKTSTKEAKEDQVMYDKFKCYCDDNKAQKKASIKDLTSSISLLEAKIEEVKGNSGELSSDSANLNKMMADNEAAVKSATNIRKKENEAFKGQEADLKAALEQVSFAVKSLSEVGADQTAGPSAAHTKFMADYGKPKAGLVAVDSAVSSDVLAQALATARTYMSPHQRATSASLLQNPFGTYTSQSAEVLGMLKNMLDNFKANLADARGKEKSALDAFNNFMKIKTEAFKVMKSSYDEKQQALGQNDGTLAAKKSQLTQAKASLASDQKFLANVVKMYNEKTAAYEQRKQMRANEDAAISQVIEILNSDASFESFSTVSATSGKKDAAPAAAAVPELKMPTAKESTALSFIQMSSSRRHLTADEAARQRVKRVLEQGNSERLSKVAALVQETGNPFATVLAQIEKMTEVINKEAQADRKKLNWCNTERGENNDDLKEKQEDITELDSTIDKLKITLYHKKQGLMHQIEMTESSLQENTKAQSTQTEQRTAENVAYQKDVKNLIEVQALLDKSLKVLKTYYDQLEKNLEGEAELALLQQAPEAPADKAFTGQSKAGGDAISMLEFIKSESHKEEMKAHADEEAAQAAYEDAMTQLKTEEAEAQQSLSELQASRTTKEKELLDARNDLKKTKADKQAINAYLDKIKAGCDFITNNMDLRKKSRAAELQSLRKAKYAIKGTPAYQKAAAALAK